MHFAGSESISRLFGRIFTACLPGRPSSPMIDTVCKIDESGVFRIHRFHVKGSFIHSVCRHRGFGSGGNMYGHVPFAFTPVGRRNFYMVASVVA